MVSPAFQSGTQKYDPRSVEFVSAFTQFLVSRSELDELGLRRAQRAQATTGERFDAVLLNLALLDEERLLNLLADFLELQRASSADLGALHVASDVLDPAYLRSVLALPIADDGTTLRIAVADPFARGTFDGIGFAVDRRIEIALMPRAAILDALDRRLEGTSAARANAVGHAETDGASDADDRDTRRLRDLASQAPTIRFVNELIQRAAASEASDIHIEPGETELKIRMRIDGVLHLVERLGLSETAALVSRIKIMARLDIAERRLPQDGRIRTVVRGRELDLRVSTMPTVDGESVVLRLLDTSSVALDFAELGFDADFLDRFRALVEAPNGIVLVSGPTGSGKTTTLYTALTGIDRKKLKVLTVEDPVEYRIDDVNQIQVQPKIGLNFATVLRSTLRHDPDVVMVGEIRDLETARIAVQASLTGHLVLSTVHTNSAPATVTRLIDMGIEPYLLASTLRGVLAQRLVRRLCAACAKPADISPVLAAALDASGLAQPAAASVREADRNGCPACRHTGFKGRTMILELMVVDRPLQAQLVSAATEADVRRVAQAGGMRSMYQHGLRSVLDGVTTLDEVLRVTGPD